MSNISKIQVGDTTYDIKDAEAERIVIKNGSGSIVSFDDGIEAPTAQVNVKIEPVQEGSGDPSPDNVRPITGWTGVNVTRTGKNLLPNLKSSKTEEINGITYTCNPNDGSITANGTATENAPYYIISSSQKSSLYLLKNKSFIGTGCPQGGSTATYYLNFQGFISDGIGSYDTGNGVIVNANDFTNFNLVRIYINIIKGTTVNNLVFKPMIRFASDSDDTYEPYQGDTYDISFGEAGTVYGGELDIISGKLVIDRKKITLNQMIYSSSYQRYYITLPDCLSVLNDVVADIKSNYLKTVSKNALTTIDYAISTVDQTAQGITIRLDSSYTTIEQCNAYLTEHPLTVIYPLATPITYQLTPTEVTTLLGQNNIWADTGDISVIYWKNKLLADSIHSNFSTIKDIIGAKKYGVKGIGQAQSELTRTYDSVNMVAAVGSPTLKVQNDFDNAAPFMRKKCVGYWEKNPQHDKRAMFHVMAYEGDANYTEDGTMGDYVAVECPRCYYKRDGDELIISAYRHQGFRAFDIFCHEHNQNDTMEFYYMPAYPLALKDGHAVSLPGLRNEQGDWATLYNSTKTYNNEEVAILAQLMPAAVSFYEWALMTVEFATQNMQNIMYGVAGCYWADNKTGQFTSLEGTITFECTENPTAIIAGDYVRIGTYSGGSDNRTLPSHKVLTATSSNSKRILTLEPTGWSTISYTTGTNYYISGSHVPTGLTKDILTPSGVEEHTATNTHNAIRYRYHENPYGNQYHTSADLFDVATIIPDATTTSVNVKYGASLDWYYLPDATSITTAVNPANNTTSLSTDERFVKLGVSTPSEKYTSGYIKNVQYDIAYPDIWAPETTEGGSATTYFSDQVSLVNSNICRSCRFGGAWYYSTSAGPLLLNAVHAPSYASTYAGGDLYFPQ